MPTTIDDYLAVQPPAVAALLREARAAIQRGMPQAQETRGYQMPAYRLGKRIVLYFAAWKKHWSIYPLSEAMHAAFADELSAYSLDKGTIRFPLDKPVPADLVERLAAFRAQENYGS